MKNTIYLLLSLILFNISCKKTKTYELISSKESGVLFNNEIIETETFNILTEEYIFNGGGVAIGDFDNNGLSDVFFSGNQVTNKLYINKGDFKFEDISSTAGIEATDRWNTGIAVVDINLDGWLDLYVCSAMAENKENLLFVNQGLDKDGKPHFKELAQSYGLNDANNSMNASFFDYDKDGLLDLYVLNNEQAHVLPTNYRTKITDGTAISNDRLYKNLGNGTFEDVTLKAGITYEGFGLGIAVADINYDGWPDLHISNDYLTNDLLYINNQDGTFTNKIDSYLKHQSKFSMGSDISDFDNDGYLDIVTLDMLGESNERMKTTIGSTNYLEYVLNERYDYQYQYMRNMLHKGNPTNFSEIGLLAGVSKTDWSWSPLFMDVDNDGFKDLLITNGFPRDITDKDFGNFSLNVGPYLSAKKILDSIPTIKIPNYAYKNQANLEFSDATQTWGLDIPSFSNGAAYVDLDNDGDLDYVVNNINDKAFVFKNTTNKDKNNFIRVAFEGPSNNPLGIGAKIKIYHEQVAQNYENYLSRGYLSSVEGIAHFGVGKATKIDSILIQWPNGYIEKRISEKVNQTLVADFKNATPATKSKKIIKKTPKLLTDVTKKLALEMFLEDPDFNDFSAQRTLPHKLSQNGPSITVGDLNGDQMEDLILGSATGQSPMILLQKESGGFIIKALFKQIEEKAFEEEDIALLDIDNDGDLDLYLVSGSNQFIDSSEKFIDRLYLNDGNANFTQDLKRIPVIATSGSVAKPIDFDNDGFMDLLVAGRTPSTKYPLAEKSYLLKNNKGTLEDVTEELAAELRNVGMITDAIWTDYNGDNKVDLVVVGELMSITFFENNGTGFNIAKNTNINSLKGWWETIEAKDLDQDGDIDFVVGNIGQNNFYKPTMERPYTLISKDFDNNGYLDAIPFSYLRNKQGTYESYPLNFWGDINQQSPIFRKKFNYYKDYANTTEQTLFSKEELKDAYILKGNFDKSVCLENTGNGQFKIRELPIDAQLAPINDFIITDVDSDGYQDIIAVGNDFGNEIFVGRYDALNGLVLKGDGKGNFKALPSDKSGFLATQDAKRIASVKKAGGGYYLFVTQNKGNLIVYEQ